MKHYRRYWKRGEYPIVAILVYEYSPFNISELPYDSRALNARIARGADIPYWIHPLSKAELDIRWLDSRMPKRINN